MTSQPNWILSRQAESENDHYRVLGVLPDAGIAEIKKAYRNRLKEVHPDLNPELAGHKVDQLVLAYRTLIDPELRKLYDRTHGIVSGGGFDYRSYLKEQTDPANQSRLIFFDLLHGEEESACSLYLSLKEGSFTLSDYLDREDYMDCGFILAEELFLRQHPRLSFPLLRDIIDLELRKPYFRHFFPEVLDLVNTVIDAYTAQGGSGIELLEDLLTLGLPDKETAEYLKKAALFYFKRNQFERSRFYLGESKRLNKNIQGLSELEKNLERKANEVRRSW